MTERDEAARLRELDTYRVLDTLPEAAYDDIVRLASILCDAPIALISLVDRDRQWLKARQGFEESQTPRDVAFCDHAIRDPGQLMEVRDATRDARFAHNPYVTQAEGVRFYAGMPLVTPSGAAVGTVCVIDRQPRELTDAQRAGLASLARITMNLLEARHRFMQLERKHRLRGLPDSAPPAAQIETAPAQAIPDFAVVVFEVQDYAGAVARTSERAVERALDQFDHALDACLDHARGDQLSRSTFSPESIVVLRGPDVSDRVRRLQDVLPVFAQQTQLHVLSASARADSPNDTLDTVFLRADSALSQVKNGKLAA